MPENAKKHKMLALTLELDPVLNREGENGTPNDITSSLLESLLLVGYIAMLLVAFFRVARTFSLV